MIEAMDLVSVKIDMGLNCRNYVHGSSRIQHDPIYFDDKIV